MKKLNSDDLTQVSGGKFTNAVYNDNMRSQLNFDLGEAERNIDKNRLFMKLNDDEIKQNGATKSKPIMMQC